MRIKLWIGLSVFCMNSAAWAQMPLRTPAHLTTDTNVLNFHAITDEGVEVYLWDSHDFDYSNCLSQEASRMDLSCIENWVVSCAGSYYDCSFVAARHSVVLPDGSVEISRPVDEFCMSLATTTWELRYLDEAGRPLGEPFLYILQAKGRPWMDHVGDCEDRIPGPVMSLWTFANQDDLSRVFEESFVNHPEEGATFLIVDEECPHPAACPLRLVEDYPSPNITGSWLMLTEYDNLPEK